MNGPQQTACIANGDINSVNLQEYFVKRKAECIIYFELELWRTRGTQNDIMQFLVHFVHRTLVRQ